MIIVVLYMNRMGEKDDEFIPIKAGIGYIKCQTQAIIIHISLSF